MKIIFTKSQEFFVPHLLWKDAPGKVEKSITNIKEQRKLALENFSKELSQEQKSIVALAEAEAKKSAIESIDTYLNEYSKGKEKDKGEKESDIWEAALEVFGDEKIAMGLLEEIGFRSNFRTNQNQEKGKDKKYLSKYDIDRSDLEAGKLAIESKIKDLKSKIPENESEEDPDETDPKENPKRTPLSPEEKEILAETIKSLNDRINTIILLTNESLESDPKNPITLKNAAKIQKIQVVLVGLGKFDLSGISKEDLTKLLEKIDINVSIIEETDVSESFPEIENLMEAADFFEMQNSVGTGEAESLLEYLPKIRRVFTESGGSIENIKNEYKDLLEKELNAFGKERRPKALKGEAPNPPEFSPLLESFFANIENGEQRKSDLIAYIDNPNGKKYPSNYFDALKFSEDIEGVFSKPEITEGIVKMMEDPDYKLIDDSTPEGARFVSDHIDAAKAAGATRNMRKEYINYIKESADIPFLDWLNISPQKETYGSMSRVMMSINKFMDGPVGDIIKMLGFGVSLSFNGYTQYEEAVIERANNKNTKKKESNEGLRSEYSEADTATNIQNFSSLNENERKDLWETKIGTELNPTTKKQYKKEYWEQYAVNTEGAKDIIPMLKASKNLYGNAVDFLDLENNGKVCSPEEFKYFQEKNEESPYKEFLLFGQKKGNGSDKLSFDVWEEVLASFESFSPDLKIQPEAERIVFTAENSPEKIELLEEDWNESKIKDLINKKLPKLQEQKEETDSTESSGIKKFMEKNPEATTAAAAGLLTGLGVMAKVGVGNGWNPVGWGLLIGAGAGYGGYKLYNWWKNKNLSEEKDISFEENFQDDANFNNNLIGSHPPDE